MSEPERFEVLILGSGFGGKLLAWHMAQSGRRTAVVERRWIGGSCPNIACLPSKNEIWGAKIAHQARHAAQFGTMITGPITIDMAKVRQRKRDMVEREIELQKALNPPGEIRIERFGWTFCPVDKIMQVENDYDRRSTRPRRNFLCHGMSRGRPTLTESRRVISSCGYGIRHRRRAASPASDTTSSVRLAGSGIGSSLTNARWRGPH